MMPLFFHLYASIYVFFISVHLVSLLWLRFLVKFASWLFFLSLFLFLSFFILRTLSFSPQPLSVHPNVCIISFQCFFSLSFSLGLSLSLSVSVSLSQQVRMRVCAFSEETPLLNIRWLSSFLVRKKRGTSFRPFLSRSASLNRINKFIFFAKLDCQLFGNCPKFGNGLICKKNRD